MRSSRTFFASLVTASASDHAVQPMLIFLSAAWAEPSVRPAARHEAAARVRVLEKKPIVYKPPVFVFSVSQCVGFERAGVGISRCRNAGIAQRDLPGAAALAPKLWVMRSRMMASRTTLRPLLKPSPM